MDNKAPQKE